MTLDTSSCWLLRRTSPILARNGPPAMSAGLSLNGGEADLRVLAFSRNDGRYNAPKNSHRGCGNASRYRKRPDSRQQGLHIESYRNVAPHLWPCDQEDTDPSCSGSHLDDVAGPDEANRRGRRCRRSGCRRNLFIHVRADQGVSICASGDGLISGKATSIDHLFPLARVSPFSTTQTCRSSRCMSAIGATADVICSERVFRLLTRSGHRDRCRMWLIACPLPSYQRAARVSIQCRVSALERPFWPWQGHPPPHYECPWRPSKGAEYWDLPSYCQR